MEETAHILIVDDEISSLYTLEMLLSPEPYEIKLANSPEEAFVLLDSDSPDVILLDVMMPGITGYEVCQRLKGDDRWRHIPVILVTALDGKDDLVQGLNSGADEFISKPVNGPELRARVRSMLRIKKQYDEIQETLYLREELANMIIHDMRTPISAIVLYVDLLSRLYDPSDNQKRVVPKLRSQAQRLNSMLTDMLLVAKMKSGKLVLNCTPANLVELVETTVADQQAAAKAKGITMVTELPDDVQLISLDGKMIQRTIENLLSNALKFSPEDSTVTVRLASYTEPISSSNGRQTSFRLQVTDEGPGIPEEFQETIFDRYEVIKMKTADIPQVGIGLAFCKMVVEAHGGNISVGSNQPQGAVFTVEL
jgi:two-component system sensor histidine kinase/response regulator